MVRPPCFESRRSARALRLSRERAKDATSLEEVPEQRAVPTEPGDDPELGVECLRRCLAELSPENRDLILSYYKGEKGEKIKNRKGLKELFGVPASTLRMRALRLRERLQMCAENCVQRQESIAM